MKDLELLLNDKTAAESELSNYTSKLSNSMYYGKMDTFNPNEYQLGNNAFCEVLI